MQSHHPSFSASVRTRLTAAGLVLAGLGVSCGQTELLSPEQAALLNQVLDLVQEAPSVTAFEGQRTIEWYDGEPAVLTTVYTELVRADGAGAFSIDPLELVQGGLGNEEEFLLREGARAGWNWRYRDLRVQDVDAFLSNYSVLSFGEATVVAGRNCQHLEVAIAWNPFSVQHSFDIDVQTGLILKHEITENEEHLRYSSEYTSFQVGLPSTFAPYDSAVEQQPLGSLVELAQDLGFEVHRPRTTPDPYYLVGQSTVFDPSGLGWGLLEYTDGIETLFLLQRPRYSETVGAPRAGAGTSGFGKFVTPNNDPFSAMGKADLMTGYRERGISVLQADLGDQRYIAVGRVGMEDLRWWLESVPH